MRDISSIETLVVPDGVTVTLKARTVTVEGPRGTLRKNVGHIQMDIQLVSLHFIRFRDGLVRLGNRTDEWQFARRRDVHLGLPEDRTFRLGGDAQQRETLPTSPSQGLRRSSHPFHLVRLFEPASTLQPVSFVGRDPGKL